MLNANAGRLMVVLGADIRDYRRKMKQSEGIMRTRTGNMERVQGQFISKMQLGLAGAAIALGAFTIKSVQAWNKLNESMANVATLIPGNTARVKELRSEVQRLSITFGKTTEDIAGGLYQTISAFQDSTDTIALLRIGAETAMAGLSSTREALDLLIPMTKGYGDVSKEAAEKASDLAFMTVKLGVTTIPELSQSMGRVAPLAYKLGVEIEELSALFSTLTGATGKTALVTTQITGIMRAMIKPTEAMSAAIKKLGYESASVMISELGLVNALNMLIETTDGSEEALGELFENARALPGVFHLSGKGVKEFHEELAEMYVAMGARKTALKEQTDGVNAFGFALKKAGRAGLVAMQEIGRGVAFVADEIVRASPQWRMLQLMMKGRMEPADRGRAGVAPETMLYGEAPSKGPVTAAMAAERAAERAAKAWAKLQNQMRSTLEDIETTPMFEKIDYSLTQINKDYAEMNDLVIVSADRMREWSDAAEAASAHVTEGIYSIFDALEAEDFWGSLYQSARRYFQMLIAESVRSRAYAWFLGSFSGGNVMLGSGGPMPTGNPNLGMASGGGGATVNLINNSGMPLDASASIGAGGSIDVILEGPIKKLFGSGRMDGTMKQFNAYRTVG